MHDTRPIIGITTNFLNIQEKPFINDQRIYVNRSYSDSITKAGGIPLLIPISQDREAAIKLLEMVDGVLFSGGQDIDPAFYGEDAHSLLGETLRIRDEHELFLLNKVREVKKPILGICRGMQLLNVSFGGTLHQDLTLGYQSALNHFDLEAGDKLAHTIEITSSTELHRIYDTSQLAVNSFHHQAIKDLAKGFEVCAQSQDGVIEAIAAKDPWALGVQWHPETMRWEETEKLFKAFIERARLFRSLS